jgi:UDP-galactopyranose mutase
MNTSMSTHGTGIPDVICLSHLRWNFVYQRPQHLMTRCARDRRVFFVEEPLPTSDSTPHLRIEPSASVTVVTPMLPEGMAPEASVAAQRTLITQLVASESLREYVLWYYTPMALPYTDHLAPRAVVYDCMDELAAFKGAPALLTELEARLIARASLVLTGGHSLYEAKRHRHPNIHPFPSSVDVPHFAAARSIAADPADQAAIPHPRLGFFGVIDERLDIELVAGVAAARPEWHVVMVGPIVKIDPASLPMRPNIHYLGAKTYAELPHYVAGWDVALLPFARNEATRFISPTKTPEYLAAGKPVVSTSIRDVVRPYGQQGLVRIADNVDDFVRACDEAMNEQARARLARADAFLSTMSWDATWARMCALLSEASRGENTRDRSAIVASGTASAQAV